MKTDSVHLDNVDFIKGIAAISVILLHTLPVKVLYGTLAVFHIWQAVPIFLFVTFYLGFRNLERRCNKRILLSDRIKKIIKKLWEPLLILAVFEALFFFAIGNQGKAIGSLLCYENGPSCYYIWVYMQIWLLMPLIYLIIRRLGTLIGGVFLLIISVLLDSLWEIYIGTMPGFTCFRYLFLGVPAYMFVKGVDIRSVWPLILISMSYLALMIYSKVPVFADSFLPDGWEQQTSLSFFYTLFLFVVLSWLYNKLKQTRIKTYITHVGTISWEVFIVQMVLIGSGVLEFISSRLFPTTYIGVLFKILMAMAVTLIFAEIYKRLIKVLIHINK